MDIATKNFMRHLQRHHINIKEIEDIFQHPKNSTERKNALALFRNETNFKLYLEGNVKPNRRNFDNIYDNTQYYPCAYCKGLFLKIFLKRHIKVCIAFTTNKNETKQLKLNHISRSHTVTACAADPTNVISQLNVKEQVNIFVCILFILTVSYDLI